LVVNNVLITILIPSTSRTSTAINTTLFRLKPHLLRIRRRNNNNSNNNNNNNNCQASMN